MGEGCSLSQEQTAGLRALLPGDKGSTSQVAKALCQFRLFLLSPVLGLQSLHAAAYWGTNKPRESYRLGRHSAPQTAPAPSVLSIFPVSLFCIVQLFWLTLLKTKKYSWFPLLSCLHAGCPTPGVVLSPCCEGLTQGGSAGHPFYHHTETMRGHDS